MVVGRLRDAGRSKGYAELLYLTALMYADTLPLIPENGEEQAEWRGHLKGLRSALVCLARAKRSLDFEDAAAIVNDEIDSAKAVIDEARDPEG